MYAPPPPPPSTTHTHTHLPGHLPGPRPRAHPFVEAWWWGCWLLCGTRCRAGVRPRSSRGHGGDQPEVALKVAARSRARAIGMRLRRLSVFVDFLHISHHNIAAATAAAARAGTEGWHFSCVSRERLKMDLPFVNVLCVHIHTRHSDVPALLPRPSHQHHGHQCDLHRLSLGVRHGQLRTPSSLRARCGHMLAVTC